MDAFLEYVSPDVRWHHPPGFPEGDLWCGRDELRGMLHEQFDAVFDAGTVDIQSFTRAPQGCLVAFHHSVQAQTSGMDLDWAAWFVMTVEDGLITQAQVFLDRAAGRAGGRDRKLMQVIEAEAHSAADREAVWRVVADARGWSRWGAWQQAELEREGDPPPGGVGAIKALTRRPVVSREEVTVFEPPSRFGYRLLSGLPLRGYEATITLTEAPGGGTGIRWRSQFEPKIPLTGGMFRRSLGKFVQDTAERLAREAERS